MNELMKREYECWTDDVQRILSFHFVEKFIHQTFETYRDYMTYVIKKTRRGFKVQ